MDSDIEQVVNSIDSDRSLLSGNDYKYISYKDKEYLYKVTDECTLYGETIICDPNTPIYTTKKRLFGLGKSSKTIEYKTLFVIGKNIENPEYSKSDIKKLFKRAYDTYQRELEIRKGELL